MRLIVSERQQTVLTQALLLSFVFLIPLSSALQSICLIGAMLSILCSPTYWPRLRDAYNSSWGRSTLAWFTFIFIACFWTEAYYFMQREAIENYLKLLCLPILAVGFSNSKLRFWAVNAYLAAMCVTCIICWLKFSGLLTGEPSTVAYDYITTGCMMALAAYIAGLYAIQFNAWPRILYLLLMGFSTAQIFFISKSRTAYIIYLLLMSLLLVQKLPLKKAFLGILLSVGLIALVYTQSPVMQTRVADLISDIKFLHQNQQNTSLGYRLQFHNFAQSLFERNPLIGVGTAGFRYNFIKYNPVPSWGVNITDPHSQYWLALSENGLIGLGLMLIFLGSLVLAAFKLRETQAIFVGVLIAVSLGFLTDTLLSYSAMGYVFIAFSALCCGELVEKRKGVAASLNKLVYSSVKMGSTQ